MRENRSVHSIFVISISIVYNFSDKLRYSPDNFPLFFLRYHWTIYYAREDVIVNIINLDLTTEGKIW